jgi:hypothetical protein
MRIGTKSVLFGAHAFYLHPWFVALAWWKLYGFPWDPRLWVAFFVHDLGYWGKPNMDGPEGEEHPEWGARVMYRLAFWVATRRDRWIPVARTPLPWLDRLLEQLEEADRWERFVRYHSRFLAKRDGQPFSRLCVADKLAVSLEPAWLYLPRVILTGEIREYMALAEKREGAKYASMNLAGGSRRAWFASVQSYLRRWAAEHQDGREDTWTPGGRVARDETGVWS